MNNRTEPTKEQNEAAIRALKRETRGTPSQKLTQARVGIHNHHAKDCPGMYSVTAYVNGQAVNVADVWFHDGVEGWINQDTARIMAEELADRINEQQ